MEPSLSCTWMVGGTADRGLIWFRMMWADVVPPAAQSAAWSARLDGLMCSPGPGIGASAGAAPVAAVAVMIVNTNATISEAMAAMMASTRDLERVMGPPEA